MNLRIYKFFIILIKLTCFYRRYSSKTKYKVKKIRIPICTSHFTNFLGISSKSNRLSSSFYSDINFVTSNFIQSILFSSVFSFMLWLSIVSSFQKVFHLYPAVKNLVKSSSLLTLCFTFWNFITFTWITYHNIYIHQRNFYIRIF